MSDLNLTEEMSKQHVPDILEPETAFSLLQSPGDSKLTSRHLSQTARDLPESLGPTGGGVGHHAHVVSHVSEVLRQRDSCQDKLN